MDTKRLFIGFRLNDDWENAIQEFISGQISLSVNWVPEENRHLTLLFLGDYPQEKVTDLHETLETHFRRQKPFAIPFDTFVYAPNMRKAHMIWCKGATNNNFSKLVDNTYSVMQDFYKKQALPFEIDKYEEAVPHITLSRFQRRALPPLRIPNAHAFPMPLACREVILFESTLKPEGAEYQSLETYRMGA